MKSFDSLEFVKEVNARAPLAKRSTGAAEALDNARVAVEQDPIRLAAESDERRYSLHFFVAVCVSPSLEVAEALLRDQTVPIERLDPVQVGRFGH